MAIEKPKGWLDKYSDNVAATDATRVSKQLTPLNVKKVTQQQLDQREVQARRDRIAQANSVPQSDQFKSAEAFAKSTSATADKLRASEYPNIFDDYLNPYTWTGEMASKLGEVPLAIKEGNYGKAAATVALPAMIGLQETMLGNLSNMTGVTDLLNTLGKETYHAVKSKVVNPFLEKVVDPVLYSKEMSALKKIHADAPNYFNNPETVRRLQNLEIDDPSVLKYPELTFSREGGSHYNPLENKVNINLGQASSLKSRGYDLTNHGIYDHEMGHWLQRESYTKGNQYRYIKDKVASQNYRNNFKKSLKEWQDKFPDQNTPEAIAAKPDLDFDKTFVFPGSKPTEADVQLHKLDRLSPIDMTTRGVYDNAYFNNAGGKRTDAVEPYAFLRETKRDMIDKGFLKDEFHRADPELIESYLNSKPNSRIGGIADNSFKNYLILANSINKFPSVAPIIGAGALGAAAVTQEPEQKKNGGWLDKYNDGGPIQPNYNDYSVSAGPGFQGDGYSNVGRNYSPAWGGQFQDGGELPNVTVKGKRQPIVVTNPRDPRLRAYNDSLAAYNASKNLPEAFTNSSKKVANAKTSEELIQILKERSNLVTPLKPFFEKGLLPSEKGNSLDGYSSEYMIAPSAAYKRGKFVPGALYPSTTLFFKKPTRPVIYEKPKPVSTPQSTIDFMEGNYGQEPITEIPQPQPQVSAYGEVVDPRTGYTHMTRQGSPMYPMVGQNVPEMAMGGSIGGATQGIPGATGFMYARTGSIPSNGKYAKKTKASAQNGKEMKFYQNGLDFEPKSISRNGSVIKDDRGQWDHPGEITEIGSNQITMQGVPYPVMGVSDTGDTQMMYPNQEYQYDGNSVTEYPMMAEGGKTLKNKPLVNLGDFTMTPAELEYVNSPNSGYCPGGNCLENTKKGYDMTAGRISGIPNSNDIWTKDLNLISTASRPSEKLIKENPYFEGDSSFGSADSWDIHGAIVKAGGKNIYSQAKGQAIPKDIAIGSFIGWGPAGTRESNHSNRQKGLNTKYGLQPSHHSTQVVSYNEQGEPIVYDSYLGKYGTLSDIAKDLKSSLGYELENISVPKSVAGNTRENLTKRGLLKNELTPYKADLNKLLSGTKQDWAQIKEDGKLRAPKPDREKLDAFAKALSDNKGELISSLRIKNEDYDRLANTALAIAMTESEGGGALGFADNFGSTQGMTQLNPNNIKDDKRLSSALSKSYKDNISPTNVLDPSSSALATMMYLSVAEKDAKRLYDKGLKPGVKTFNQPGFIENFRSSNSRLNKDGVFIDELNKRIPYSEIPGYEDNDVTQVNNYLKKVTKSDKYSFVNKDGDLSLKMKTKGNNPKLTDIEKIGYMWQSPNSLKTGDAEGKSEYVNKIKNYYNLLSSKKMEQGGQLTKLDQLTNFTNYNTKQPGGWLDKYQ